MNEWQKENSELNTNCRVHLRHFARNMVVKWDIIIKQTEGTITKVKEACVGMEAGLGGWEWIGMVGGTRGAFSKELA